MSDLRAGSTVELRIIVIVMSSLGNSPTVIVPVPSFFYRAMRTPKGFFFPGHHVGLSGGNDLVASWAAVILQRIFFADGLHHVTGAAFCFHSTNTGAKPLNIERLNILISVAAVSARHWAQYQFFASECSHAAQGVP